MRKMWENLRDDLVSWGVLSLQGSANIKTGPKRERGELVTCS